MQHQWSIHSNPPICPPLCVCNQGIPFVSTTASPVHLANIVCIPSCLQTFTWTSGRTGCTPSTCWFGTISRGTHRSGGPRRFKDLQAPGLADDPAAVNPCDQSSFSSLCLAADFPPFTSFSFFLTLSWKKSWLYHTPDTDVMLNNWHGQICFVDYHSQKSMLPLKKQLNTVNHCETFIKELTTWHKCYPG